MVLLLVMALGMLSLSSISLRTSNSDSVRQEAQTNARLALMIAIGELQKTMGPDQRISARALNLANDPRVGGNVSPNTPQAWWVGVAGTNPNAGLNFDQPISAENPAAQWLVSGLSPSQAPDVQLSTIFDNPVDMFAGYSIDLSMTGGMPIQAGITRIDMPDSERSGGYAWIIDDEGLKAALAPRNPSLVNTTSPVGEGDLTPGAYDVAILDGMSALQGNSLSVYSKILSTGDLSLVVGGDRELASGKRLSYTAYSRGVLCDVKNGGLKRDLTVAFEDDATFAEVFPRGSDNYTSDYLCIDPAKLATSPELLENGYIHWAVFRDYYNIKRYIKTAADGTKHLDPVRYTKTGVFTWTNGGAPPGPNPAGEPAGNSQGSLLMAGRLGPHEISDSTNSKYPQIVGVPYGDYQVKDRPNQSPENQMNHDKYKHSPVIPILQRMQCNAWLEQRDAKTLRTHFQMWSSHYNPYNISLNIDAGNSGPRIHGTPRIRAVSNALGSLRFFHRGVRQNGTPYTDEVVIQNIDFGDNKNQFHGKDPVMLKPGRSHVLAFETDANAGVTKFSDGHYYNDKVKDLTVQSIYRDLESVSGDLPDDYDIRIEMTLQSASLHHGLSDSVGGPGTTEVCQTFWAPFSWNKINNRPGKIFNLGTLTAETANENKMASLEFSLRTTREPGSNIRPLVDANIRSMLGNSRWDSPLNLPLLASYQESNQGEAEDQIMQMSTVDDPKGYTYWGAGRDPFDGHEHVILFDIPRTDLVSLGQLQHAGAGRFSYEPSYIVGNSYANPRISLTNWKESITDTFSTSKTLTFFPINNPFNIYDASYLVNEVLWDGYTFTTIPQVADNASTLPEPPVNDARFENLISGDGLLANARHLPYAPIGSSFDRATLQMASSKADRTGAFYHNAGHILNDGAFNVNSTSVDAWEAFLSSTHSLPFAKMDEKGRVVSFESIDTVRFPRVQTIFGEGVKKDDMDENFWIGFRALEQTEVRELATAIVEEVEKRGPFLSMADFVNRKLENGELGKAGALQAALDATVNAGISSDFGINEQAAGFPGQLLQGDILQALAPRMTVRSDTFTIRAYGESLSKDGKVLAKAWCEATVQRFPDPVSNGTPSPDPLAELIDPSSEFGRTFRVTSFRWLHSDEL